MPQQVELNCLIRSASGQIHKPSETGTVVREDNKLGRPILFVKLETETVICYPEEVNYTKEV